MGPSQTGDCVKRFFPLHVILVIRLVWKRLNSSMTTGWNPMVQSGDLATVFVSAMIPSNIYHIFIILNDYGSRFLNT